MHNYLNVLPMERGIQTHDQSQFHFRGAVGKTPKTPPLLTCTLQDAPVECNRAFINRFETVLADHILDGDKILGDVADYAIRYECQGRGSLHVHMCVWLGTPADVAALDQRIRADIPAEQDATGHFVVPEDPLQRRLYRSGPCVQILEKFAACKTRNSFLAGVLIAFTSPANVYTCTTRHHQRCTNIARCTHRHKNTHDPSPTSPIQSAHACRHVIRKQQHACYDHMGRPKPCMKAGHCSRKFPQPIHLITTPQQRDCGRRFCYYCPRECDRSTVPYLPDLALLFDAHVNLVKVVAEEWSAYLLKYAAKSPPGGTLHLSPQELFVLGFATANAYSLAIATQFATTHVYQPAELALLACGIAVFRLSRVVAYVDLRPPERRTRITSDREFHSDPRLSSQQAYGERPNKVHRGVVIANMICVHFHRSIMTLSKSETKRLPGKFDNHKWRAAQAAWGSTLVDPAHCPVDADAAEEKCGTPAQVRITLNATRHSCT